MKRANLTAIAIATALLSGAAGAAETRAPEIIIVTAQRTDLTAWHKQTAAADVKAVIDFAHLAIEPPRLDDPDADTESKRLELARGEEADTRT